MQTGQKRKTSLTLDGAMLDRAKDLGLNVSALAEAALARAVADAARQAWLAENADAFAAQAAWHDRNPHPLADIMVGPGQATWAD